MSRLFHLIGTARLHRILLYCHIAKFHTSNGKYGLENVSVEIDANAHHHRTSLMARVFASSLAGKLGYTDELGLIGVFHPAARSRRVSGLCSRQVGRSESVFSVDKWTASAVQMVTFGGRGLI